MRQIASFSYEKKGMSFPWNMSSASRRIGGTGIQFLTRNI